MRLLACLCGCLLDISSLFVISVRSTGMTLLHLVLLTVLRAVDMMGGVSNIFDRFVLGGLFLRLNNSL